MSARARNETGGLPVDLGYAHRMARSRIVLGAVVWALFLLVLFGIIR